ncbi:MAG: cytochrome c maturation protein CcmE [Myxococcales bacterium]|nr:cytochrome c maturation protein CcmE [Myxococcales bacterium]
MTKGGRVGVVAALVVAAGAIVFLAVGGLGKNLVYYWSPTELLDYAKRPEAARDAERAAVVRLGGEVKPGSIVHGDGASDLTFVITDGAAEVKVHSTAVPPQMFREGIGVVVEGRLGPDGVFRSEQLMVKHGNDYRPPKDGEKPDWKPDDGGPVL